MVAETPSHKQASQVLRRTPAKQKNQNNQTEESDVVEESPVKQVKGNIKRNDIRHPKNWCSYP